MTKKNVFAKNRYIKSDVRKQARKRDKNKCVYCGHRRLWKIFFWRKNLEYGHVIPFSQGGNNCIQNIQMECFNCNRTKRATRKNLSWFKRWTRKEAQGCRGKCRH